MNQADNLLFYGSSVIVLLLNLFLLKSNKTYGMVSLIIQSIYTAYFNYGLQYDSEGGVALVWWFYLIMINCLHFIINIAIITINNRANKKKLKEKM
jgi:hypothetical protein